MVNYNVTHNAVIRWKWYKSWNKNHSTEITHDILWNFTRYYRIYMSMWREITATQHGLFYAHDTGGIRLNVSAMCRPVFTKPLTGLLHQSRPSSPQLLLHCEGTKIKIEWSFRVNLRAKVWVTDESIIPQSKFGLGSHTHVGTRRHQSIASSTKKKFQSNL
jgi:hypothetical protein